MNNSKTIFKIAITFFIIGTLLFLIQLITSKLNYITIIGFYYVILSIIINSLILLILLILLIKHHDKKETLKSITYIVSNIPIAMIYYVIVTDLLL